MKSIRYFLCILFIINVLVNEGFAQKPVVPEPIVKAFKEGDASSLAKYMNSNVELLILSNHDVYSKTQSELIVKNFFATYRPTNFTLVYQGVNESSRFGIGRLTTNKGNFSVYFLLKNNNQHFFIHQLKIEKVIHE